MFFWSPYSTQWKSPDMNSVSSFSYFFFLLVLQLPNLLLHQAFPSTPPLTQIYKYSPLSFPLVLLLLSLLLFLIFLSSSLFLPLYISFLSFFSPIFSFSLYIHLFLSFLFFSTFFPLSTPLFLSSFNAASVPCFLRPSFLPAFPFPLSTHILPFRFCFILFFSHTISSSSLVPFYFFLLLWIVSSRQRSGRKYKKETSFAFKEKRAWEFYRQERNERNIPPWNNTTLVYLYFSYTLLPSTASLALSSLLLLFFCYCSILFYCHSLLLHSLTST